MILSADIERLRAELKRPGRSQIGLAKRLGVDASAVSKILSGKREIKARELAIIEDYLAETAAVATPIEMENDFISSEKINSHGDLREAEGDIAIAMDSKRDAEFFLIVAHQLRARIMAAYFRAHPKATDDELSAPPIELLHDLLRRNAISHVAAEKAVAFMNIRNVVAHSIRLHSLDDIDFLNFCCDQLQHRRPGTLGYKRRSAPELRSAMNVMIHTLFYIIDSDGNPEAAKFLQELAERTFETPKATSQKR